MKEYELSRWSKGVITASPMEDFIQIMLYFHNKWYDNRAVICNWLLFVLCLHRCVYLWLYPATVILPAPPWAPGRLLPLGLFWVKWFVSKREALMPECCVYVSLSVLGMASAYPDAGISWVLVCVRACTPIPSYCQHSHFHTTTSLWWVYQIGISWHPLPLILLHTLSTSHSDLYCCLAEIQIQDSQQIYYLSIIRTQNYIKQTKITIVHSSKRSLSMRQMLGCYPWIVLGVTFSHKNSIEESLIVSDNTFISAVN